VAKARAELQFFSQTYGPQSPEFEAALAKLKKAKAEDLSQKSLPQQERSLADQISAAKKKWWATEEELQWTESEIVRLNTRFADLHKQNDFLGDEIEELMSQLEVVQAALAADQEINGPDSSGTASAPAQKPPVPPRSPADIAALLQATYQALQSSQLPTVTAVSSQALEAILQEVNASVAQSQSQSSQPDPSQSPPDQHQLARQRVAWTTASEGDPTDDVDVGGISDLDVEGESEEFHEGADVPPNADDDPDDYIQPRRRGRKVKSVIGKPPQSAQSISSRAPVSQSHRGPGGATFEQVRAERRAFRSSAAQ
jgi:hypothetical protein